MHSHTESAEAAFGPSEGAVVLDIGGDIGAAVIHTTAALDGAEIEITPVNREWDGTHVAVRRRLGSGREAEPIFCAVFSRLPTGVYRVRVREDATQNRWWPVTVTGSQVSHIAIAAAN
jgi:hypothetical protein